MRGGISLRLLVALVLIFVVAAIFGRSVFSDSGTLPFAAVLLGAFLIGAAGYFLKPAPWLLAGLAVLAYLAAVGWMAVGVVGCPHCDGGDGPDRLHWFGILAMVSGLYAVGMLAVIAAGAMSGFRLRRLREQ